MGKVKPVNNKLGARKVSTRLREFAEALNRGEGVKSTSGSLGKRMTADAVAGFKGVKKEDFV